MCPLWRRMTLKALEHRLESAFRAGCRLWVLWKFSNLQEFASTKTQVKSLPLDIIYFPEEVDVLLKSFPTSCLCFFVPRNHLHSKNCFHTSRAFGLLQRYATYSIALSYIIVEGRHLYLKYILGTMPCAGFLMISVPNIFKVCYKNT